jgi:Delta7-sterol 5-desaturase
MTDPDLLVRWLHILGFDFLRYALTAAVVYGLLWVLLSERLSGRRILDGGHRTGEIPHEIGYSMLTVLIFATNGLLVFSLKSAGYTRIYSDIAEYGWVYWWLSVAVIIVVHDAYFYWTHRLLHRGWWFRHVHSVHHRSTSPTPWAAYSFHPVEAVIQAVFLPVFVLAIPIHGAAIFVFLLHMIVNNCVGHSGFEILPWRAATRGWLRWKTTVTHHHFHHARNRGNYGLYFTWWDRLCGTEDASHRSYGDANYGVTARRVPT